MVPMFEFMIIIKKSLFFHSNSIYGIRVAKSTSQNAVVITKLTINAKKIPQYSSKFLYIIFSQ